ncbi:MAG: hypothetical protein HC877_15270 [Thioploca sp.]|nr:hypothetical protein [Thioploca sp.]
MSTCDTLKQQITELTNEIKSLQEDLKDVAGAQKWAILRQIKGLQGKLTNVENEFNNKCKPPPEPAEPVTLHNLTLAVKSITSIDDSTEASADEPYILVVAADLTGLLPAVEVTLYGPWADVEKGETHGTLAIPIGFPESLLDLLAAFNVLRRPFWGLNNKTPAPIANVSDVAFFVCVMEHDDGSPSLLRQLVKGASTLAAINGKTAGLTKPDITKKIKEAITDVIGTPTGIPNYDDVVGVQQLILTANDLNPPPSGIRVLPALDFGGGKEGMFRILIELVFAS